MTSLTDQLLDWCSPEPNSGCWLWALGTFGDGYGCWPHKADGKQWRAHRAVWTIFQGAIPDGLHVLHRCDTPLCVNPDHLWLGTHADNHADKAHKGRGRKCPLTPEQAERARAMRSRKMKVQAIADVLGVSKRTVEGVLYGC